MGEQAHFEIVGHGDARVLQQRGDIVGRMAQHAILEVDDADPRQPLAAPAARSGWANDSRAAPRCCGRWRCPSACCATATGRSPGRRTTASRRRCAARTIRPAVRPRSAARRDRRAECDRNRSPGPGMVRGVSVECRMASTSSPRDSARGSGAPSSTHALRAEILDDGEPRREIAGEDLRRREALGARSACAMAMKGVMSPPAARWRCRACRSARAARPAGAARSSGWRVRRPASAGARRRASRRRPA